MPFPDWLRVHDPAYAARVLGVRPDGSGEAAPGQPADARRGFEADVDALMALVAEQAAGDAFAVRCVTLLGQARAELGNERPDMRRVVAAMEQVRRLLIRAHESDRAMTRAGLPLAVYCAAWLGALTWLAFGALRLYPDSDALSSSGAAWLPAAAALWGAMGGVLDALFALWQRFGERTFDARFWLWYVLNPALGAGLGIVVYLLSATGYLAVTGAAPVADGVATTPRLNPNGVILLAFVAGFKQTTSYAVMSRTIGSVFNAGADRGAASGG